MKYLKDTLKDILIDLEIIEEKIESINISYEKWEKMFEINEFPDHFKVEEFSFLEEITTINFQCINDVINKIDNNVIKLLNYDDEYYLEWCHVTDKLSNQLFFLKEVFISICSFIKKIRINTKSYFAKKDYYLWGNFELFPLEDSLSLINQISSISDFLNNWTLTLFFSSMSKILIEKTKFNLIIKRENIENKKYKDGINFYLFSDCIVCTDIEWKEIKYQISEITSKISPNAKYWKTYKKMRNNFIHKGTIEIVPDGNWVHGDFNIIEIEKIIFNKFAYPLYLVVCCVLLTLEIFNKIIE